MVLTRKHIKERIGCIIFLNDTEIYYQAAMCMYNNTKRGICVR
jgi:hypothetical protein